MKLALTTAVALVASSPGLALAPQGGACPPFSVVEEAVLSPSSPDPDFGQSVSASGKWVVVSGRTKLSSGGSELIFYERNAQGVWVGQTRGSGHTASMEGGRTVVAGSSTSSNAKIYELGGGSWNFTSSLTYSGCPHEQFGRGIDLDGDVIAVGAPDEPLAVGHIEVFDWDGSSWNSRYVIPDSVTPVIGQQIALDGRWMVSSSNLALTIYELFPTTYTETHLSSLPSNNFGAGFDVQGDTVVVGSPGDDEGGLNTGRVFFFDYDGAEWVRGPELVASDAEDGDKFGASIAIDGNRLLVGAAGVDGPTGTSDGAVYVFEQLGGTWIELGRFQRTTLTPQTDFGARVALSGDNAVVGLSGIAFAFRITALAVPTPYCAAGTTASGCTASVTGMGTPSASATSGFTVQVAGVEGKKDGTLYFGTSGTQASPWGNGSSFQCVVPPVVRTGVQQGSGTGGLCDGSFIQDFNAWMAAHPTKAPPAGTDVQLQCWFRDPQSTSNQGTSLSDGLLFSVCP